MLLRLLNELTKRGNGPAHKKPACPSSGRKPRPLLDASESQAAICLRFDSKNTVRLYSELLKKRAAWRIEGKCIGENPNSKPRRHEFSQGFQCALEGDTGFALAHVFIEIEVRQSGHNEQIGRESTQELRDAPHQFRKLKTRERSGDPDEPVKFRWRKTTITGKTRNHQRIEPIGAVEIEHLLSCQQNMRQEIMRQPSDIEMAAE